MPYFVVGRQDERRPDAADRLRRVRGLAHARPTAATTGRGWLARGGTYVVANIRGGGEYGPELAPGGAARSNRLRAYEDFAAVAEDLVDARHHHAEQLGIQGGSNGGLLMGVMLTQLPGAVRRDRVPGAAAGHAAATTSCWPARRGWPSTATPTTRRTGRTSRSTRRTTTWPPGRPYPPTLFITSTRDDRVHPGHARKMVARLTRARLRRAPTTRTSRAATAGGRQRAAGVQVGAGVRVPVAATGRRPRAVLTSEQRPSVGYPVPPRQRRLLAGCFLINANTDG